MAPPFLPFLPPTPAKMSLHQGPFRKCLGGTYEPAVSVLTGDYFSILVMAVFKNKQKSLSHLGVAVFPCQPLVNV